MSVKRFISRHPQAYRQLLAVGCLGMLVTGVGSMTWSRQPAQAASDWQLVNQMMVPVMTHPALAATPTQTLPGQDGSTTTTQAQADLAPPAPAVSPAATVVVDAITSNGDMRGLGRTMNAEVFGDQYWEALNQLWTRESNWNPVALSRSGACGIPQALPCSKITDHSPQGQISWGLQYIQARYGNPGNAWAHEVSYGWY
jgi:hypothetical protein